MAQGQIHIYTGDGKGKTTAAIGLAVRAAGNDFKVFIGQFIKDIKYHEIGVLESIDNIDVELFGTGQGCLIDKGPSEIDFKCAMDGLKRIEEIFEKDFYDVIICDEICCAYLIGLLTEDDILNLMSKKPDKPELILTGRGATDKMIASADLVSEMKSVKHYFETSGLMARDGIER